MCGRYALALVSYELAAPLLASLWSNGIYHDQTPAQVRQRLSEQSMPSGDNALEDGGQRSPRQTYNFAPGYYGIVYRAADIPGSDAGSSDAAGREAQGPDEVDGDESIRFKLQSMKWGLVPSWTKKSPDYRTTMKTINCRAESLSSPGGMWSTIKSRKRCVVIAQGFYEWLKTGPKDKLPHYVKRKDDQLMCFAGLWDCAYLEGKQSRGQIQRGESKCSSSLTCSQARIRGHIPTRSSPRMRMIR